MNNQYRMSRGESAREARRTRLSTIFKDSVEMMRSQDLQESIKASRANTRTYFNDNIEFNRPEFGKKTQVTVTNHRTLEAAGLIHEKKSGQAHRCIKFCFGYKSRRRSRVGEFCSGRKPVPLFNALPCIESKKPSDELLRLSQKPPESALHGPLHLYPQCQGHQERYGLSRTSRQQQILRRERHHLRGTEPAACRTGFRCGTRAATPATRS